MVIGIVLGVVLAVMRLSSNPLVAGELVLHLVVPRHAGARPAAVLDYISALYPTISLGDPVGGPELIHRRQRAHHAVRGGHAGLGLNEAAYMAEIVRAGIISVDAGQTEAAKALGMTRLQTMRRIVLPQAMRSSSRRPATRRSRC